MPIYPTIHLGGTNGEDLLDENKKALRAVKAAIDALEDAYPNGRDYYPQGPSVGCQAARDHISRLEKLSSVAAELSLIVDNIFGQVQDRASRKRQT